MVGICVQEKEMEKQKLLYQQARLHDRGAAEMVLQTISASKGKVPDSTSEGLILQNFSLVPGNPPFFWPHPWHA